MKKDKIKIEVDEHGLGKIILNGKDISNSVTGLTISADAGKTPEVTLKIVNREINAQLEGVINLQEATKEEDGHEKETNRK